jgi:signal transduction histidine kinase
MTRLVDDLLRLSRLGARALEPIVEVDMRVLVDTVVETIRNGRPLDMRIGELPTVAGNADLLRQVWTNLIDNAIKYSRDRPTILVEIAGRVEGREALYTVTDHGAGFDPANAEKLFTVFQRLHTDAEFEGTGVGLALVHRIVTRHGGRVWADGRPGQGATFGFALPVR